MNMLRIKKFATLLGTFTFLAAAQSNAYAQGMSEMYLKQIADNTREMLSRLNDLPTFIKDWTNKDTSQTSIDMQGTFSQMGQLIVNQENVQTMLLAKINSDLLNTVMNTAFNNNYNQPNPVAISPTESHLLPYANDLVYSTLINKPFIPKDPRKVAPEISAYNYIRNASGLNIYHPIPGTNWQGTLADMGRYQNYYNTVMAVESYNAYLLSSQYAENEAIKKDKNLASMRARLIAQATDSEKWFANVLSENIGIVLRQILMYDSQSFVLLNEILKTQKEAVAAQAMNNALLIAANQLNEIALVNQAGGQF